MSEVKIVKILETFNEPHHQPPTIEIAITEDDLVMLCDSLQTVIEDKEIYLDTLNDPDSDDFEIADTTLQIDNLSNLKFLLASHLKRFLIKFEAKEPEPSAKPKNR